MPPTIAKPLPFNELQVQPELITPIKLSNDMQQVLSLLTGFDGSQRRLLRASPSGVLHFASCPVKDIINFQAEGDADTYQPADIPTSEVLIRAKPTNTGRIWVKTGIAAAVDVGYPLDSGELVVWGINNLSNLHFYFTKDDDWVIIVYTK